MMMAKITCQSIFDFMGTSLGGLISVLIIGGGLFLIGFITYLEEKWQ